MYFLRAKAARIVNTKRHLSKLKQFLAVEKQGYRPVPDNVDLHIRAELAKGDFDTGAFFDFFAKPRVFGLGRVNGAAGRKTGTPSLSAVAVKGKLRDNKQLAANVQKRLIHAILFILKYIFISSLLRKD